MITSSATPVVTALVTFLDAVFNLCVLTHLWVPSPDVVAAINTVVLAAFGFVAALRANAQHNGTLVQTAKPDAAQP